MYGIRLKLKQGAMYGLMEPTTAVLGGSAILGYMGQQDATSAANARNDKSMAMSMDQWRKSDPFSAGGNREQYVGQLNKLMQGGVSGIADDPNFKAMMAQGLQQSQRHASATGTAQSGQEQIALQKQGALLADTYFQQQYNRLAQLSGATSRDSLPGTGQITPQNEYDMTRGGYEALGGVLQAGAKMYSGDKASGPGYSQSAMLSEQVSGFDPADLAAWGG